MENVVVQVSGYGLLALAIVSLFLSLMVGLMFGQLINMNHKLHNRLLAIYFPQAVADRDPQPFAFPPGMPNGMQDLMGD